MIATIADESMITRPAHQSQGSPPDLDVRAERLRQAIQEADEGMVSPWEYDEASA